MLHGRMKGKDGEGKGRRKGTSVKKEERKDDSPEKNPCECHYFTLLNYLCWHTSGSYFVPEIPPILMEMKNIQTTIYKCIWLILIILE